VLTTSGFLACARVTAGRFAPPLDDAYIHYQYATRLAAGEPFRYLPGDACTSGATSTLWPALLAPAAALGAHDVALHAWAIALGVAALAGTAWLVSRWATALSDRATGALAGLATATAGPLVWAAGSGMEVAVAACALAGLLAGAARGRAPLGWALVLSLTRPEGALVAGVVLLPAAVRAARAGAWGRAIASLLPPLAGLAVPAAVARLCSGSFLPNSVLAKRNPRFPAAGSALDYAVDELVVGGMGARWFGWFGVLLVALAGVGLVALVARDLRVRRAGAGLHALAALAVPVVVVARTAAYPFHHLRYLMPFLPVLLVAALVGARATERAIGRSRGAAPGAWLRGAVVVVVLANLPGWAHEYAANTRDIATQQVRLAEWVATNTPPDARVAINDAGAMGHLSGRRLLDLEGIVSPGVIASALAGEGSTLALLGRERPDYVVLFPAWFEGTFRAGLVHEVARASLTGRTISGGDLMVVGTLDVARLASGRTPPALRAGERIVDALDVSDLADEAAHAWTAAALPRDNRVIAGQLDGATIVDGARRLAGEERFAMRTAGGRARLVGRFGPGPAGALTVGETRQALPEVPEGAWIELTFPMASGDVRVAGDARTIASWWWIEG
jgi:hypothetical protein